MLGPILGPLLGGYITDNYAWRWIFYINVPIGALALIMNWAFIFDPPYLKRREKGETVDFVGLGLLTVGLGCLQIVLDKGQQDDWFSSDHILILSIVSAVCLVGLVFWELNHDNPILDLRIFKNVSFAAGNAVMFFGFFAFFGSIVLLPLYLQELMGYTAFLAGVVLGPGGLIMLVLLPMVGKLTERIDARYILFVGLGISAYSLFNMAGFTLDIDIGTAVMARNIQAVGIAGFFVPLSYLTMASIRRREMNNASALFNLLRNLGGSFGVAFVTTLLARRAQFHQARLVEHLTPYDPDYQLMLRKIEAGLRVRLGDLPTIPDMAQAVVDGRLMREVTNMAFMDVFHAQGLMFLGLMLVMWVIRKPEHAPDRTGPGAH